MKYLVCIKHVPDTETKVAVHADGNRLDPQAVNKWGASPYDEYALEQALRFREAAGEGEVVAVCAGPQACQATLRTMLATGADRAVLIEHEALESAESLTRAKALAAVVAKEQPDMVLLGKYGVGTDEGSTGPMLAELLEWPHVAAISSLELDGPAFTAARAVEGAVEIHEGSLPAVFTCEKGLNEPRLPSLRGIMQSKKKPIETLSPGDLDLDDPSSTDPKLRWDAFALPPARPDGRIIEGDAETAAKQLVRLLHEEAKVL
ncbi:MAG: electron transfer flavoprotein subunit beta [Acidobacteria bacterium]|nr:electron transfer flavoprotein subunit beta [Acidobacteriota bacterium]NIM62151.1 electron transfer flavoprotein subunit beta [Acidobacteriota bacterium]NIO59805.1 electron transfer flavoprotein subunit beta [Acidobacteriota bacterium]NIQ30888.1 electron transfer flavoprotein subunit beta [Acidobacteriota bacterium]NIQ85961.1 electron transfer flavoprotein subunit beta [Acidobacteriota bacterium]